MRECHLSYLVKNYNNTRSLLCHVLNVHRSYCLNCVCWFLENNYCTLYDVGGKSSPWKTNLPCMKLFSYINCIIPYIFLSVSALFQSYRELDPVCHITLAHEFSNQPSHKSTFVSKLFSYGVYAWWYAPFSQDGLKCTWYLIYSYSYSYSTVKL